MSSPDSELAIYECSTCGGLRLSDGDARCCDGAMDAVETTVPTESPDVEDHARRIRYLAD